MKIHNIILSILLITSINLSAIAGGGWTPKKRKGFFKFGQSVLRSDRFYGPDGVIIEDIATVSLYSTSIYGEYGFTDRLAGIIYAPFFVRTTINNIQGRQSGDISPGDEANGLGDFDIGLKYALVYNKSIAISTSLTLGLPLGVTAGGRGKILQTGDGEFNQLIKVEASKSFYPIPLYMSASIGFNNRTKGFSEEFHFGFEVGYTFEDKLTATLKVYNVSSFKNGDPTTSTGGNGIFSNNTEYFSYGPELSYKLNGKLGITGAAAFALSGERILAAPSYNLGIFMTF